jgi:hypothetical protein
MYLRRNSHHEFTAVRPSRNWLGHRFLASPKICDRICYQLSDTHQSLFLRFIQPAHAWEFHTQSDVLLILLGPGNTIGISIYFLSHHYSLVGLLLTETVVLNRPSPYLGSPTALQHMSLYVTHITNAAQLPLAVTAAADKGETTRIAVSPHIVPE